MAHIEDSLMENTFSGVLVMQTGMTPHRTSQHFGQRPSTALLLLGRQRVGWLAGQSLSVRPTIPVADRSYD